MASTAIRESCYSELLEVLLKQMTVGFGKPLNSTKRQDIKRRTHFIHWIIDIDIAGPIAGGMINQQTIMFTHSVTNVNRNIVGHDKYLQVIAALVVFG